MADAATQGLAAFASVLKRSHLKPEIYNTVDSKVDVLRMNFLIFLLLKLRL